MRAERRSRRAEVAARPPLLASLVVALLACGIAIFVLLYSMANSGPGVLSVLLVSSGVSALCSIASRRWRQPAPKIGAGYVVLRATAIGLTAPSLVLAFGATTFGDWRVGIPALGAFVILVLLITGGDETRA